MAPPRYFFALFGKPNPPEKDTVESGIHHPHPDFAPFPTRPGDILLLYCAAGYVGHEMVVPGIGVVLGADNKTVTYRYLPLDTPIPKSKIDTSFTPQDLSRFKTIMFKAFWLFEIGRESFIRTLDKHHVSWP